MAFISDENGVFVIAIMDDLKKNKEIRTLTSSFRKQDFEDLNMLAPGISWNPSGTQLAISAKAGGQDAVFITDVETGAYQKLTWGVKSIQSVQWSPDGKKLIFVGSDEEQSDLYMYEFESEELTKVTDDIFSDEYPKWSADSKSIYFISDRGDMTNARVSSNKLEMWDFNYSRTEIYKIEIGNDVCERITNDPRNNKTSLDISSDEKKLLYVSDK
ncbi:MAG: DPP IV N-terminal domain-containing protein, partial [Candidatus Kapaibacterium sp.]